MSDISAKDQLRWYLVGAVESGLPQIAADSINGFAEAIEKEARRKGLRDAEWAVHRHKGWPDADTASEIVQLLGQLE